VSDEQAAAIWPAPQGFDAYGCYPPSQTEKFLTCPQLWDYEKRWEPIGIWQPHALMGTALGAGLDLQRQCTQAGVPWVFSILMDRVAQVIEKGWTEGGTDWTIEGVVGMCEKVLKKAVKTDVLRGGTVLGVQIPLGPQNPAWKHSNAAGDTPAHSIADLIVKLPDGSVMIHDDKFHFRVNPDYLQDRLAEAETLWQLWDYAWRWDTFHGANEKGEPGTAKVSLLQKHVMVLNPQVRSETYPVTVTPGRLAMWKQSAFIHWQRMHAIEHQLLNPGRNYLSCRKPWRCSFYAACHDLEGKETTFGALYRLKDGQEPKDDCPF